MARMAKILTRTQALALFLVIAVAAVLLAARVEYNTYSIRENQTRIELAHWQSCVDTSRLAELINAQQEQLAREIEASISDKALADRLAKIYRGGHLPMRDCGPRPS